MHLHIFSIKIQEALWAFLSPQSQPSNFRNISFSWWELPLDVFFLTVHCQLISKLNFPHSYCCAVKYKNRYGFIHWCWTLQHEEVQRGCYELEIIIEKNITTNDYSIDTNWVILYYWYNIHINIIHPHHWNYWSKP